MHFPGTKTVAQGRTSVIPNHGKSPGTASDRQVGQYV
jgi:hypothetical protein